MYACRAATAPAPPRNTFTPPQSCPCAAWRERRLGVRAKQRGSGKRESTGPMYTLGHTGSLIVARAKASLRSGRAHTTDACMFVTR